MMELTCTFLLVSTSLVLATPHGYGGYGVKGGASARAEASASAGAFGGVPVPVPLGAGYSGSFSKSSSSSSASSSASSSSSSSSFSYSGSGAGGFGLNGGVPNHGGCSAGNCHSAGGNGIPTPHGASPQGYNSANAAASAEAGAVPEVGCHGLSCDDSSDKCKSGSCKSKPHPGTTAINSDPKKCTSGQCGSAYENGATATDYDSNDIRAVSDSSHNVIDHLTGTEKNPSHDAAGSDCLHGKCGSSGSSISKPNDYGHDLGNYYQGSSTSNKQQGSSFDTGITSQYQKPSSHLETPKLGSECTSGNCYAEPAELGHETSPSSYNVPIHAAYDKGSIPKPLCDGVKCENQPKGPHSSTDNTVTKGGPSSFEYPSAMNCVGSSCFGIPTNQATGRPTHTVKPSNVQFGQSPSNAPTLGVTTCNSPNCSPYPTNPAGSIAAPGHIGHGKPGDGNEVSNDKLPAYTGGFGGPTGLLNPNEYVFPAPISSSNHGPISTHTGKPSVGAPTGCDSPSCSGYPSASRPTGVSVPEGTYNQQPGGNPSEKLPTYTGGFGGPSGMLKPNEYGVHGTVTNNPNYAHNGRPSYNTQSPAGNTGKLDCKVGENCGGYTPSVAATSGATAPSGYYGTTKPNTGIHPNDGFGGPGVISNPNKHYSHATGPSSLGNTPTETLNTPTSSGHPEGCKTPNCYSSFGNTVAPHAQSELFGGNNPSSGLHLSSVTLPAYTSSYDRPSGVHGSSGVSGPASTPSFAHSQPPYSPGSYSTGCKTGNCANSPASGTSAGANAQSGSGVHGSSGVSGPASTPSFTHSQPPYSPGSVSTGCKTENCANGPTSGTSADANAQSGAGVHGSSGVSGPASTLSFTHYQPPYSPGSYSTGCKTGNCANGPTSGTSAGANEQSGSFGGTNVNTASTHPQYTGGFGGPSGTFKPNEQTYATPSTGSAPANCQSPNCVGSPSPSAEATSGAIAQPGSYGATKPSGGNNPSNEKPIYTGGFGGAAGLLKPNEYTIPAASPKPNNKPTGVPTTAACTSGKCDTQPIHSTASDSSNAASGAHATAAAAAEANAVVYSGGFGGPPGVLAPYDNGKIGALPTNGKQGHEPKIGGAHSSHNANLNSQHSTIPVANGGLSGPVGGHGHTGAQAGSLAGATAYAGAAAGASAGAHGYNPQGSHYNHEGNVKGGSPCGGGCGGSVGGAYNGGSGSSSGAAARSLSGANSFGVGGSYASSSASAHASAGAYTKGGYGKR